MIDEMQRELLNGLSKLSESVSDQSAKIGELVGEMRQVNQSHMEVKTKLADHEERIRDIELNQAANAQTLSSTRKIFDKARDFAIGAVFAAVAAYYGMKL